MCKLIKTSKKPLMGVLTTDPDHKGETEYVPVELCTLATHFDEGGEISVDK